MQNLNLLIMEGRVTKEVELKETVNGKKYAMVGLASNHYFKTDDDWEQETTFVTIQTWGKISDFVNEKIEKGDLISVRGSLKHSRYIDQDNNEHSFYYILASHIDLIAHKKESLEEKELVRVG